MINVVSKSGNLSHYLKATSQVVANGLKPAVIALPEATDKVVLLPPDTLTSYSMNNALPANGNIKIRSGPGVSTQIRYAHTDITIPDFSDYRREKVKSPNKSSKDSAEERRNFTYLIAAGSAVAGAYGAKTVINEFVSSMSATADVLALAKIEIKLSEIPEGKSVTFKWRGKPLFIRHRTSEEIATEKAVPLSSLRDPQSDEERAQRPEWLVVIGVCTHLGCVPIADAGDFGGYYCPCHGSHYDAAGRIRKGPAPLNLEIPFYQFPEEDLLIVG